jgi:hypothetical protein
MPLPPIDFQTAEPQTLDEIREWQRGLIEALIDQRASVLHAIRDGSAIAPRFAGMTEDDVEDYFDAHRRELDRLTVFKLVVSTEATIRDDYARRVRDKGNHPLSKAYQAWHKTLSFVKQRRPDLDESGILDVLKNAHVMDNHIIGRYRESLRPRHWVGHGRYWDKPIEVDQLDPDDVYDRCNALLLAMPS